MIELNKFYSIFDIEALKDDTAKSVKSTISAHETVWSSKSDEEKDKLKKQAESVSLRHYGHRVKCPSCSCTALVLGKAAGAPKRTVDDGISERQMMKPESFQCAACGLRVSGYAKLLAAGLGDTYISTSHYEPDDRLAKECEWQTPQQHHRHRTTRSSLARSGPMAITATLKRPSKC